MPTNRVFSHSMSGAFRVLRVRVVHWQFRKTIVLSALDLLEYTTTIDVKLAVMARVTERIVELVTDEVCAWVDLQPYQQQEDILVNNLEKKPREKTRL